MARTTGGNPLAVARAYGGGILAPADPERVANARLIAAAPDLLAACERALEIVGCYTLGSEVAQQQKPVEAQLRAAVALARGETP